MFLKTKYTKEKKELINKAERERREGEKYNASRIDWKIVSYDTNRILKGCSR